MNGKFCGEAWDAVSRYVYTALQGGSIFPRMTKKDNGWKSRISEIRWRMLTQAEKRRLPIEECVSAYDIYKKMFD